MDLMVTIYGFSSLYALNIIMICGLAIAAFWVIEVIDVVRREFHDPTMKTVWLLVIFFLNLIGALAYYLFGKRMGHLPGQNQQRLH